MDLRTEEQCEERDKKKSRVGTLKKHGYSFAKRLIPKNINVPDFIYKVNFEAGKGLDDSPTWNFESIIENLRLVFESNFRIIDQVLQKLMFS